MVAERDLVAAELISVLVEGPSAEASAQRAERLARLDLLLDGEVDAGVAHLVGIPLAGEVVLDQIRPESGESLIDVQRQELEPDRSPLLSEAEKLEERPRILVAGDADQDPVTGLDQPEVPDRLAEARHQASLEPLVFAHVGGNPPGGIYGL